MGVKYVSQDFTLEFGGVPGNRVSDLIDAFSPGARTGGPSRPPSIVNFEVDSAAEEDGTETVTMNFTYQCYCGGSGKAMIYRFADAAIRKLKSEADITRNVIPGKVNFTKPPKDEDPDYVPATSKSSSKLATAKDEIRAEIASMKGETSEDADLDEDSDLDADDELDAELDLDGEDEAEDDEVLEDELEEVEA